MNSRFLVRGALLVALALVLQGIRVVLPLPPMVSIFLIGSLVNMMLVLTLWYGGMATALLLALMLPVTAYFQGHLLLPLLIPVVWLGNTLFVLLARCTEGWKQLALPALAKAGAMYGAAYLVISFLQLGSGPMAKGIMFAMSVPQLVTGILGILLSRYLKQKLPF